jgi:O-methyltransferase involved in polyketide biosynthesis
MSDRGSEAISPTAHYTGYVWARNGLSHPALRTVEGRVLYESLRPLMELGSRTIGLSLEPFLLARHRAIDALLEAAIEDGAVSQIVEVAAGLSPRGWRFTRRYGEGITYVETDLAGMVARKRAALDGIGVLSEHHRVVELDALRDRGETSLGALADSLDADRGLAIVTEGLLNYLPADAVRGMWLRFAQTLGRFPAGRYVSDLHLSAEQNVPMRAFRAGLSGFVRGRVALHFASAAEAEDALRQAGFATARVTRTDALVGDIGRGGRVVHIIEASTR